MKTAQFYLNFDIVTNGVLWKLNFLTFVLNS